MSEAIITKKKRGRPRKDQTNTSITPKKLPRNKSAKGVGSFNEENFINWILDCSLVVEAGWELKYKPYKHWYEITRFNEKQQLMMPFAFVDRNNGDIQCPALMYGDPMTHIRGNISDPLTRMKDITPCGVEAGWPWMPTHPNYKHIDSLDFSDIKD
jgi:hypothetical protein